MRAEDITAIILCGGSGRRLGGVDKPLLQVGGRTLVEHCIAAIAPQIGDIVISCGHETAPYERLGLAAVADDRPGEGPLAGIASAVPHVRTEWILTHPGDAPFPHPELVARLAPAAARDGVAVPLVDGHRQNLTLLLARPQAEALARSYADGGRAVKHWLDATGATSVDMSDVADAFFDVDTAEDLAACERRLAEAR